jgi:hypothetical protein
VGFVLENSLLQLLETKQHLLKLPHCQGRGGTKECIIHRGQYKNKLVLKVTCLRSFLNVSLLNPFLFISGLSCQRNMFRPPCYLLLYQDFLTTAFLHLVVTSALKKKAYCRSIGPRIRQQSTFTASRAPCLLQPILLGSLVTSQV